MNTPEHLPKTESQYVSQEEKQANALHLKQAQVDAVVTARVAALRGLIGKVSPSRYEALAAKVEREKTTLESFVSRTERAHEVALKRAQDLDERYFVKKPLTISPI